MVAAARTLGMESSSPFYTFVPWDFSFRRFLVQIRMHNNPRGGAAHRAYRTRLRRGRRASKAWIAAARTLGLESSGPLYTFVPWDFSFRRFLVQIWAQNNPRGGAAHRADRTRLRRGRRASKALVAAARAPGSTSISPNRAAEPHISLQVWGIKFQLTQPHDQHPPCPKQRHMGLSSAL